MKIREITISYRADRYGVERYGADAFELTDDGGNVYFVRYCGSGSADPDYVALWECNCKSASVCAHIAAVVAHCETPLFTEFEEELRERSRHLEHTIQWGTIEGERR